MRLSLFRVLLLAGFGALSPARAEGPNSHWVTTWITSPQLAEPANRPPSPGLTGATLRQMVQVSIGGSRVRVRLTNEFGKTAVTVLSVHLALSAGDGAIVPQSDRIVPFSGKSSIRIPAGAPVLSDEIAFPLAPLSHLALSVHFGDVPADITAHPGSRTTSYIGGGDRVSSEKMTGALKTDHWYFISSVDVLGETAGAAAVVVLGDSITDGRGSTTNGDDRWPDQLKRRLQGVSATSQVAVLNQGIGGNRLLQDGLGPNALARFDRDVLAPPGVCWLVVFEGVNDIGSGAAAGDVISAYQQMIFRAHEHGLRVFGATITPFGGFAMYDSSDHQAVRRAVNAWIRTSAEFDAVFDFDAAARDRQDPSRLAAEYDSGDHLHLNPAGYRHLADAINLRIFLP